MAPPAKKKRKMCKKSVGEGTSQDASSLQRQKPDLSLEMIGRVARFASIDGGQVMTLCVAVGPRDAAIVRYSYLEDNGGYLTHTLESYCKIYESGSTDGNDVAIARVVCRDKIRAWMDINTNWKTRCTADRMEQLKLASKISDGERFCNCSVSSFLVFNNPAISIELGLTEVLKFLVEEKNIDLTSMQWSSYSSVGRRIHLLAAAMLCGDEEAFRYIWSRCSGSIDIHSPSLSDENSSSLFDVALSPKCNIPSTIEFFVTHPMFEPNEPIFPLSNDITVNSLQLAIMLSLNLRTIFMTDQRIAQFQNKIGILLDAGADPSTACPGFHETPLQLVAKFKADTRISQRKREWWHAMAQAMSRD